MQIRRVVSLAVAVAALAAAPVLVAQNQQPNRRDQERRSQADQRDIQALVQTVDAVAAGKQPAPADIPLRWEGTLRGALLVVRPARESGPPVPFDPEDAPIAELAASIMRSERANFLFDGIFVKEPGSTKPSAWHQDQPYYCVEGRQICVLWAPLDPCPASVSLRCVKGSHNWGKAFRPVRFRDLGDFGRNFVAQNQRRLLHPVPLHQIAAADAARARAQ